MNRSRVVVDRIEFGQLVRFPMILRGVTQAMQPPRLVIGFLIVVAIMVAGDAWDDLFDTPSINPAGLLAPELTADEMASNQFRLRGVVNQLDQNTRDEFGDRQLDAREVAKAYETYYYYKRRGRERSEVAAVTLQEEDREYFRTMAMIDSVRPRGAFEAAIGQVNASFKQIVLGVVTLEPLEIGRAFADVFVRLPVALWKTKPWFCAVFGLYAAIVMALGGGALSRMAACEYAGRERLRVSDAIDFALTAAIRLIATPLLPLLIVGLLGLLLMAFGVAAFLPWVDMAGGLLYGPMMLVGFVIAFVLLCYAGGFLMVIPAVATENCGPAHAHERAYAYLLARPLHLLGYVIVGLVGLAIGYLVVSLFAVTTLNVTSGFVGAFPFNSALSVGGGFEIFNLEPRGPGEFHEAWHSSTAAWFISFWQTVVISVVAAYVLSYAMTCSTAIYLLMRRLVDHQDMTEIWRAGLVPGTLAPMPKPLPGNGESDQPARSSRSESMMRGLVRRAAKARFGGGAKDTAEAPAAKDASTPPSDAEETELGPELLGGEEADTAGQPPATGPAASAKADEDDSPKPSSGGKSGKGGKKKGKKKSAGDQDSD